MKAIKLTNGGVTIVDDEDFEWLNQWKWYVNKENYVCRYASSLHRITLMHREILNTPSGMETDHINGNRLDNRRENIRICTTSQNQANRSKTTKNTSGYKGVSWSRKDHRWVAKISVGKKDIRLGGFINIEDAVNAYDNAAREYFGEFARTNHDQG